MLKILSNYIKNDIVIIHKFHLFLTKIYLKWKIR